MDPAAWFFKLLPDVVKLTLKNSHHKGEYLFNDGVGGCANWYSHYGNQVEVV